MIQSKKVYGTLGLAMKAGKVVSGEFMTEKAIRDGMASLVIVAEDASANTKKKFKDSCSFYHVPCAFFGYAHAEQKQLDLQRFASANAQISHRHRQLQGDGVSCHIP